jgi:hypothetical protein
LSPQERTEDECRVELLGLDNHIFDVVVDRGLLGGTETRTHVDPFGAQRQRSGKAVSPAIPPLAMNGTFNAFAAACWSRTACGPIFNGVSVMRLRR